METFNINGNDKNIPIVETDYYKWLLTNRVNNIHSVDTKIDYLISKGFKLFIDKLSSDDLFTLQSIEQFYYRDVCVN